MFSAKAALRIQRLSLIRSIQFQRFNSHSVSNVQCVVQQLPSESPSSEVGLGQNHTNPAQTRTVADECGCGCQFTPDLDSETACGGKIEQRAPVFFGLIPAGLGR